MTSTPITRTETGAPRNPAAEETAPPINRRIRQQADARLHHYAQHPEQIPARLKELGQEWDIERTLEANAATLIVVGAGLALLLSRKFAIVPLVVGGFLLQHAIQGWCPPLPLFRRMGVRTKEEIQREYYALKALRGDFDLVGPEPGVPTVTRAIEA